ncbi:hypothetical protein RHGRI_026565 [Rhododendron griersonianum]|uniref:Uncharacterized protein n=1 Tax=Rhododendron griersonianum TaxID=479676 RepID=A0AAV6IWT3_9ERIC|nr:hypothetical protein RHGRI_026565 [Rhododendron griersonianum]
MNSMLKRTICLHQRPQSRVIGHMTIQSKYRFEDNTRILVLRKSLYVCIGNWLILIKREVNIMDEDK